jgi:hypothetical protein
LQGLGVSSSQSLQFQNASAAEKQNPDQSLSGLFTDDKIRRRAQNIVSRRRLLLGPHKSPALRRWQVPRRGHVNWITIGVFFQMDGGLRFHAAVPHQVHRGVRFGKGSKRKEYSSMILEPAACKPERGTNSDPLLCTGFAEVDNASQLLRFSVGPACDHDITWPALQCMDTEGGLVNGHCGIPRGNACFQSETFPGRSYSRRGNFFCLERGGGNDNGAPE